MWNKDSFFRLLEDRLQSHRLIVVSNREPYLHQFQGNGVVCVEPDSGMVTAIDPIMRACGGTWVAHGGGTADRVVTGPDDRVNVPPNDPSYTLRRVWLTREQEEGYYYGLSNEGLWPLCHIAFTRPVFRPADWQMYRQVNEHFCDAVLKEVRGGPTIVWIQDFHFALLPRMLKNANPELIVAQFWHVPWPNRETFRAFPWKDEFLDGLLGNDLLGFHLRYHCQNFLDTVDRSIEAKVDTDRFEIVRNGRRTLIRAFPISIDTEAHEEVARSAEVERAMDVWHRKLGLHDRMLGIGIDRIDYTKGIPERIRALDLFFERYPSFRGKIVFVQVGVPSRTSIPQYQALDTEVDLLVREINDRWGEGGWQPIVYIKEHQDRVQMAALHRLARFCLVSSLHDGMNLVAKEFVASRVDDDGVLILSQFTGSARELLEALQVNPFAVEEICEAIRTAVEMSAPERRSRMKRMRATVAGSNIYRWAGKVFSALLRFDFPEPPDRVNPAEEHEPAFE